MAVFSPSMMCASYENLKNEVQLLEEAGADRFHLDVMDGHFVPNFAMGINDVRCIAGVSTIETELHLMIEKPSEYIPMFAKTGINTIFIHPESEHYPIIAIQKIFEEGKTPGIVLSPGASIESVIELLSVVNKVIVMGVNPGRAGQAYLPYVDRKIEKLLKLKDKYDLEITIDGACSKDKIQQWSKEGVEGFVLGTSALFGQKGTYQETIKSLRQVCVCGHV